MSLSCHHAVHPHHTCGDQGLEAVRQANLGKDTLRVGARARRRLANTDRGSRQSRRWTTGRHQANIVMLAGGAQPVLDHPRILHQFGEIEDTTMGAETSRDAT